VVEDSHVKMWVLSLNSSQHTHISFERVWLAGLVGFLGLDFFFTIFMISSHFLKIDHSELFLGSIYLYFLYDYLLFCRN
jgi:uncharacterized membrane protein